MKCPHCQENFHDRIQSIGLGNDRDAGWVLQFDTCPSCSRLVVLLESGDEDVQPFVVGCCMHRNVQRRSVYPRKAARPPAPKEVPSHIAEDYSQASLILEDSPKAAAALGRRCLQSILRERAQVKPGNLAEEIQQVLDSGKMPSYIAESVDAIRNIGNFAAHPVKSSCTGQIVPVEPGEAEWTLDVLGSLFDFYYVQPMQLILKQDALNKKLKDAGKPPMKT